MPPTTVELVFAEAVRSPDPKIAITIEGYEPVEVPAAISGKTVTADLAGVDIPGLTAATYPVSWKVGYRLVAGDGDPFNGSLEFTVAAGPAVPTSEAPPTTPPPLTSETTTTLPPSSVTVASSEPPSVTTVTTVTRTEAAASTAEVSPSSAVTTPSTTATSAPPATSAEPVAAAATSSSGTVWWIVGVILVLLIGGGAWLYVRNRGRTAPPSA